MSTIIKEGQASSVRRSLKAVDLADHLAEARSVVEQARREADLIVARSQREAREALEEAKKTGYRLGYHEGRQSGTEQGRTQAHDESIERFNEQHAAIVADMGRAIAAIDSMKTGLKIQAERDLIDFAVKIACKLTFEIGALHREAAAENLRRAVDLLGCGTALTVCLHPDDAASMRTFAESVLKQVGESTDVSLVEDSSFAPGGCVVRTDHSEVDATLETQVAELVAVMLGRKEQPGAPADSPDETSGQITGDSPERESGDGQGNLLRGSGDD